MPIFKKEDRLMDYKELIAALPNENTKDVGQAIGAAFAFLEKAGAGLTDQQKAAVLFLADVAYRNYSDTWDHAFSTGSDDPVTREVAVLLSLFAETF